MKKYFLLGLSAFLLTGCVPGKIKDEANSYCSNLVNGEFEAENVVCLSGICEFKHDDKIYQVDCNDSGRTVKEEENANGPMKANRLFKNTYCRNLNSRGNYADDNGSCENFVCEIKVNDVTYKKNCKEE